MIKKWMCWALAVMPFPLFATAKEWECSVICEFHSKYIDELDFDYVDTKPVDKAGLPLELARYHVTMISRSSDLEFAYSSLPDRCFETASGYNNRALYLDTEYEPKILNTKTMLEPMSAFSVCKEI